MNQKELYKQKVLKYVLVIGIFIMFFKFSAYLITRSDAILSDALESIINIVAGSIAFYSVWLSAKPKDREHPYGHGKVEFISAGFEGALILFAALFIIFKGVYSIFYPPEIKQLDIGIYLVAFSGFLNFIMGYYVMHIGKKTNSLTMIANGKHLLSDTYTSIGLVLGLVAIKLTSVILLDSLITITFGILILFTGYKLVRSALAGLMDEADIEKIQEVTITLNKNRRPNWIDIHNLRIQKYGSKYHIDCHATFPWYLDLSDTHDEVHKLEKLITEIFDDEVECFMHADPCKPDACPICIIEKCPKRQKEFVKRIEWNTDNIIKDQRHGIEPDL